MPHHSPCGYAWYHVDADVRLAGPAVVEEDGLLADLGPLHDLFPLARPQPAAADVVLDLVLRVLAFDVLRASCR